MGLKAQTYTRGILGAVLLFLSGSVFAIDQAIGPFSGLNNSDNPATIPSDKAQDLLNVDLSLGGRSVLKREGYGLAYALAITSSPVHGTYNFYDSAGNDVALSFHDTRMTASVNGGSATVLFSSGPFGATYQCTDSQGFAYCANTNRNNIIKTDGQTYSMQTVVTTGTMITVTPDRLVQSGFSGAPNRIDFSAAADFNSWTTGVAPTSAFSFTISAPGARVVHITQAFNRTMWFKDSSFGYILQGQTAADWVVQIVSPNVGTLDNTSVYYQGILYFRGQDSHIWSYDGSNLVKLTRDLGATINASQSRTSNSWTQTSQSDFQAGASTPSAWVSTTVVIGAVVLDTATAISTFTDTSASDFGGALSCINIDTTTNPGNFQLSLAPQFLKDSHTTVDGATCSDRCANPYYTSMFFAQSEIGSSSILSSVVMALAKVGSPGNYSVNWMSGTASAPSTILETVTLSASSVGTSSSPITINFSSTTRLTSGTTYWLQLKPEGTCDGSNYISWHGQSGIGSRPFGCGASVTNGVTPYARVFTTTFAATGEIVSRTFDQGFTTATWIWNWSYFNATGTIPSNASASYRSRTSADDVTYDGSLSVGNGAIPASTVRRYFKWSSTLSSTDGSTSPVINSISLALSPRIRPGATYYSAVKNAPNITTWDSFTASIQNNDGTQNFAIRSSTNPIQVLSSTPSWTPINSGAVPSISTGTYFQFADRFLVTNATQNPTLNDFTQNWFEGQASDKSYATYFKDAVWWSIVSGTGATTNNTILRFDLLNTTWLKYDIPINGFYTRQSRLYFGSASSGNIFKFGDVDSDNGSAINAYWKSKDFFMSSPFTDDDVTNLSTFFASVNNSSMTVTYTVDGSSSTSYTVPLYRATSFGRNNRNLSLGTYGNTFNVKFGNNAADQPFEVFALQYGITPKSWIPTGPGQ